MRIILVGLGDIAQKAYLPIMANTGGVSIGLCTRNKQILSNLAAKYRIDECFSSVADAIQSRPDAVMIHTSTESHYEIALACLNENIAVFIDKPISYDLKQVESLLNISEKKNIPFMVGFNRRHAPLYQPLYGTPPTHVRYQKNRVNLPGPASSVVFDDLIHILDFACSIGGLPSESNIRVYHSSVLDQLSLVDIHWEQGGTIYSLSMNRMSGREEECLEVCRTNEKWVIRNLTEGTYSLDGKTTILPESNWESTLHRRGFVHMIGKFLERVAAKQCDSNLNNEAWETHFLCQTVLEKI